MANVDDKKAEEADLTEPGDDSAGALGPGTAVEGEVVGVAESLGADKYVFAAFFGVAIGVAFLVGKILAAIWGSLANWAWAVRKVPQLLQFAEDERSTYTTAVGAVIGITVMVACLRSEGVRRWADGVALELSKVTWPKKETVTNGTIVVIAAGLFATVYIGLLDRLWGFVTTLVYGA
jgi:preprotein translocase subunit SecE